jgi:hypothetical protein
MASVFFSSWKQLRAAALAVDLRARRFPPPPMCSARIRPPQRPLSLIPIHPLSPSLCHFVQRTGAGRRHRRVAAATMLPVKNQRHQELRLDVVNLPA